MNAGTGNVLLPMRLPTQKSLRSAIANIIRDVQRDFELTDQCAADTLSISVGTVRNARNETTDLNSLTVAKIGAVFGPQYLDPYNRLYGATAQRIEANQTDPLPDMARSVATLCDMRKESSPGGALETPSERLNALPDLRRARASLDAYICEIEGLRVAS